MSIPNLDTVLNILKNGSSIEILGDTIKRTKCRHYVILSASNNKWVRIPKRDVLSMIKAHIKRLESESKATPSYPMSNTLKSLESPYITSNENTDNVTDIKAFLSRAIAKISKQIEAGFRAIKILLNTPAVSKHQHKHKTRILATLNKLIEKKIKLIDRARIYK